jgi:glutamate/tyrosine decarboxylase-like PLP-dependent enzyme
MEWLVSLTGMPAGAFGVFTSGGPEANLSAMVTAREYWRNLGKSRQFQRGIVITSSGAHSSIRAMAKVIDVDVIFVDTEDRLEGHRLAKRSQE